MMEKDSAPPAALAGDAPERAKLGIWTFLATEVLLFGGLFTAYTVFRIRYPAMFHTEYHKLDRALGALNTVVLVTSSLSAAWSVRCAQLGRRRGLLVSLALTLALAGVFLVVKYFEYSHKLHHGRGDGVGPEPSER